MTNPRLTVHNDDINLHEGALPCFRRPMTAFGLGAGNVREHGPHLVVLFRATLCRADLHHGVHGSRVDQPLGERTLFRAAKDDGLGHPILPAYQLEAVSPHRIRKARL